MFSNKDLQYNTRNKSNFFGRIEIQTACTVSKNPFPTVSIFAPVSLIVCDNLVPFHLFELQYVGTNPSHVNRVPDYSTYTTPLTTSAMTSYHTCERAEGERRWHTLIRLSPMSFLVSRNRKPMKTNENPGFILPMTYKLLYYKLQVM
jgi:hypothetical protein